MLCFHIPAAFALIPQLPFGSALLLPYVLKTKTSMHIITNYINFTLEKNGVVIWIAHTIELLQQAYYSLSNTESEISHIFSKYVLTTFLFQGLFAIISTFVVQGFSSEDIGTILDEDFDIAVRTGYHCAPFIHKYLRAYL